MRVYAFLPSPDEGPVLEVCRYDPGRTLHFEGQDSYCPTAVSSGELPIPCNLHQGDLTSEMNINDEVPDLMYNLKQMEQAVQVYIVRYFTLYCVSIYGVCACVRACVRACVHACVCLCV